MSAEAIENVRLVLTLGDHFTRGGDRFTRRPGTVSPVLVGTISPWKTTICTGGMWITDVLAGGTISPVGCLHTPGGSRFDGIPNDALTRRRMGRGTISPVTEDQGGLFHP